MASLKQYLGKCTVSFALANITHIFLLRKCTNLVAVFLIRHLTHLTQSIEGKDLARLGKLTGVVFQKIIDEPT